MFKFFKNLLAGRPAREESDAQFAPSQKPPLPPQHTAPATPLPGAQRFQPVARPHSRNGGGAPASAKIVQVALQSVLTSLPPELKARVKQVDLGEVMFSVPLEKILSQLPQGSVKISFGELRRAVPQFFSSQNDLDQMQVSLPLGDILAQLNPALLFRRHDQKQIEIPEDIRSPFGDQGQGLIFSVGPGKAAPAPAPARAITPEPPPAPPAQPALPTGNTSFARRPLAAAPPPAMPTIPFKPSANFTPAAPAPAPSAPVAPSVPFANRNVGANVPGPQPTAGAQAQKIIPGLQPARNAAPANDAVTLAVPLAALLDAWPESLKLEIAQLGIVESRVSAPMDALRNALQRGRVFFPWKVIRSWIKSAPPTVSAHDNTSLELPLKVIAPLFIAREKDLAKSKQKVAIDETIPNLFFGFPQPESAANEPPPPAACAVTKPVDTNYYSIADSPDAPPPAATESAPPPAPCLTGPTGTAFIAKCATPNEIVSRAAALTGVAGALIALPDGLMVASKLSSDLNGDTLAAFLPQIFGKVNQCTKELRMGELNNLNFTVGNVPWKIFRVNAIFFAAFGRAGQPLPTAELAALAGELDHKKQ